VKVPAASTSGAVSRDAWSDRDHGPFDATATNLQINYYVQVPEDTDLWLQTTNGEVHVQGTSGHLDARTTNARRVSNVRGNVVLQDHQRQVHVTER